MGQPLTKGNTAELYSQGKQIVKLFNADMPDDAADNEADKQKLVYAYGLPVPQVYGVTTIRGRQAIVMEYIQGPTLGDLLRNAGQAEPLLTRSARLQFAMHATTITELEPMRGKLSRQLQAAGELSADCRAALLERLADMPFENKLCHGDFHIFNLIQAVTRTVIIDWADASSGSPFADACRTYLLYKEVSPELAELYLQLYCRQSRCSAGDILVWAPIIAGARLSEQIPAANAALMLAIAKQST